MMSYTRAGVVALVSAALCLPVSAQTSAARRVNTPLYQGQQGAQDSPEIRFDPATGAVTLKVALHDRSGSFIPNARRNHFVVFEDGVQQRNVTVDIEHAPVTVAVLIEMGGHSQQLNKTLVTDGVYLARPLLDALDRQDKLALFTYDDALHTIVDFDDPHDKWDAALSALKTPHFSEANFYDATIQVLGRLAAMPGPKALFLITTGIDTFSHAAFDDVVTKAEAVKVPIYTLGLGDIARQAVMDTTRGPLARVNWTALAHQLETLAGVSGGHACARVSTIDASAIYDDVLERLRVRYVITYVSTQPAARADARTVQVRLVNRSAGEALRILDATGGRANTRVVAQGTYTPGASMTRTSG